MVKSKVNKEAEDIYLELSSSVTLGVSFKLLMCEMGIITSTSQDMCENQATKRALSP